MFNCVLIAIDGSKYTPHILSVAKSLCHLYTQVHVIYVGKTSTTIDLIDTEDNDSSINEAIQEALDYLKQHGISAKIHVTAGEPAEQIIKHAEELTVNLIIMGHRQLSKLSRLLAPSTCLKVIENAPCPVLIENLMKDQ